jgi:TRAP-type C4-dicarboxylate transport system substrate-binding protein
MPDDQILRALDEGTVDIAFGQGVNWASPIDIIDMDCFPPFTWKSSLDAWMLWEYGGLKEIYTEAYEEIPNVKVLGMFTADPIHLISARPIWSYEDLDGLKINSPRMTAPIFESAGAVSVFQPWEEWYLAGQTGALEGVIWMGAWECISNSFHEVFPYFLTNPVNGGAMCFATISERLYDSLDPGTQELLDKSAEILAFRSMRRYHVGEINNRPLLDLTTMPEEDWGKLQEVAVDRWDTEIAPISPRAARLVEILKEYTGYE